jgi:hypothetical protein
MALAESLGQGFQQGLPLAFERAEHGHQGALDQGAQRRPVAASDFAIHHGGTQGLFGTPTGRLTAVPQEGEQARGVLLHEPSEPLQLQPAGPATIGSSPGLVD